MSKEKTSDTEVSLGILCDACLKKLPADREYRIRTHAMTSGVCANCNMQASSEHKLYLCTEFTTGSQGQPAGPDKASGAG
jgi:hypothetical protein